MVLNEESIPFIFIGIIILCGNLFVCMLYYQHGVLHTVANKFVLSFAACDMMIALLFIPLYIFSPNFSTYVAALSSFGSLLNLLALTYERYVAIFHALRYHEILNSKKIRLLMVEVWFSTLIITLFPLPWEVTLSVQAFTKWRRVYTGILTGIITIVIAITSFVYFKIFKVNRYHMKKERDLARFAFSQSRSQSRNEDKNESKKSSGLFELLMRQHSKVGKQDSDASQGVIYNPELHNMTQETEMWEKTTNQDEFGSATGCAAENVNKNTNQIKQVSETGVIASNSGASGDWENCQVDVDGEIKYEDCSLNLPNSPTPTITPRKKRSRANRSFVTKLSQTGLNSYQKFQTAKNILREIKAARIIALIFALNCLCWLPIIIINFCDVIATNGHADYISTTFVKASLYLFVLNSMINPFLYALFKKDFRKVISRRLRAYKLRIGMK